MEEVKERDSERNVQVQCMVCICRCEVHVQVHENGECGEQVFAVTEPASPVLFPSHR